MSKDTLFTTEAGASAVGSGEFVQDEFQDVTFPASNNSGLTDTASTNPLGQSFGDDNALQFGAKALYIKDLILVVDRSKWVNGRPTYQITWHENFPGIVGYVFGTATTTNYDGFSVDSAQNQKVISLAYSGDGFGITGRNRRVMYLVEPNTSATATAQISVDGANTTTVDLSLATLPSPPLGHLIRYVGELHAAANETAGLHDFRISALQNGTLKIIGVLVYFENPGSNLEIHPGRTYLDKSKVTNSFGATLPTPSYGTSLGGRALLVETSSGGMTLLLQNLTTITSIAQGSSGTNILNLSTGHGASFSAGNGIVVPLGVTAYVGSIVTVSTDALTVSPTLPFGISAAVYNAWRSSPSLIIGASLYSLAYSIDANSYTPSTSLLRDNPIVHPRGDYAVHLGSGTTLNILNNVRTLGFVGSSFGMQVDGRFSAAEIETIGTGRFHATFMVNGLPAWSISQGQTGSQKYVIMSGAGPGWNSFSFTYGASMAVGNTIGISKINLYRIADPSASLGILAGFDTNQVYTQRTGINGKVMSLGIDRRIHPDQIYFYGLSPWARGSANNVQYLGGVSGILSLTYFGKNFAISGSLLSSGAFNLTLDGNTLGSTLNFMHSVATEGFHTIQLSITADGGSLDGVVIQGVDIHRTYGGIRWLGTSSPINIIKKTIQLPYASPWKSDNSVIPYGFGAISNLTVVTRRNLDCFEAKGVFTAGTTNGSTLAAIGIPFTIDSTKVFNNIDLGRFERFVSRGIYTNGDAYWLFSDASTLNQVFVADSSSLTGFTMSVGSNLIGNNQAVGFNFSVPISGWDAFQNVEVDVG